MGVATLMGVLFRYYSNSTSKTILDNESHTSDHLITKVEIVQMFVNKSKFIS